MYFPAGCHTDGGPHNCAIHNAGDGEGAGGLNMYTATAASVNTYFAPLARDAGPLNVAKMAQRLGIDSYYFHPGSTFPNLDEHIGIGEYEVSPLDMADAYGVFDNHGVKHSASPIVKVTSADGTVLLDNTSPAGKQVLNPAIADTVTDILKGPILHGTASGQLASFGRPAAGKTGTTDHEVDAWFVGYTPQLVTAVWMGHDNGSSQLAGIDGFGGVIYGGDVAGQDVGPVHEAGHGQPAAVAVHPTGPAASAGRGGGQRRDPRSPGAAGQPVHHPPVAHRL